MRKVLRKLMPAILSISMVASSAFMPLSSMTVYAADPEQSVNADLSGWVEDSDAYNVAAADSATVPDEGTGGETDATKTDDADVTDDSNAADTTDAADVSDTTNAADAEDTPEEPDEDLPAPADTPDAGAPAAPEADNGIMPLDETGEVRYTVKINGTEQQVHEGETLEAAVTAAGLTVATVTEIEFVSGTVTAEDLEYISKNGTKLTTLAALKLNIGNGLTFTSGGAATTVFPAGTFNSTSSSFLKALKTVELGGFTELGASSMNLKALTSVSIPDVTVIGDSAFFNATKLASVDLSKVTSIGQKAFCQSGLTSVTLSDNITSLGASAFNKCTSLTSADLGGLTAVPEAAFQGCTKLVTVDMPNVKSVEMNGFNGCTKAEISTEVIGSLDSMGSGAFTSCKAITGELDLSGVQSVDSNAMKDCTGITKVDITGWTKIPTYMFSGWTKLTEVVMPDVTSLNTYAFQKCTALVSVDLPDAVTAIPNYAFSGCTKLENIDLTNIVTVGQCAFEDCKALTELNLPKVETIEKNGFDTCSAVTKIYIPNVKSIGASAFTGIKKVVEVTIDSATPPTTVSSAFGNVAEGSVLNVPEGSLENYLISMTLGKIEQSTSNLRWNRMIVKDPAYAQVTFKNPESTSYKRYMIIKAGDAIGETPFNELTSNGYQLEGIYTNEACTEPAGGVDASYKPSAEETLYLNFTTITVSVADKDGKIVDTIELPTNTYNQLTYTNLSGTINVDLYPELPEGALQWNTKPDGSGQTILGDTKIYSDITLYPIFEEIINVTVKVNGSEAVGSSNLANAVAKAGADSVTELEVVSGRLTADDYDWMNTGIMSTIEKLVIAEGVESENKTLPGGTAQSAPNLTYLEIHGVETAESAAIMANNLETLILPDIKTLGTNSFGTGTNGTHNLTTVEMPEVTDLGSNTFSRRTGLPELNFPKLERIGSQCFYECGAVRIVTNQVPVITDDNAFEKGSVIVVPYAAYTAYVEENGTDQIGNVTLEAALPTDVLTVTMNGKTYGADSLEDAVGAAVEAGDILSAASITEIEFLAGTVTDQDLAFIKANAKTMRNVEAIRLNLSENLKFTVNGEETTVLPDEALRTSNNLAALKTIKLKGFTEIGTYALSINSLKNVVMPDVTKIGDNAFRASSIASVDFTNIKEIGAGAFYGSDLGEVTVTADMTVGDKAFSNCEDLAVINWSGHDTITDYMFDGSKRLKELHLDGVKTIGDYAFRNSTGLAGGPVSIDLTGVEEIGRKAFGGCKYLTSVNMPDVRVIGKQAFDVCPELREIAIPACIESIGEEAFSYGSDNKEQVMKVTIKKTTPPEMGKNVFEKAADGSTVTVPEGSLTNYLPDLDVTSTFEKQSDMIWKNLLVAAPDYSLITYTDQESSQTAYALVKSGEAVGEARIPAFTRDNYELAGWNTAADGTGAALTADTVPTGNMTVYAIWEEPKADTVRVKINDTEYGGESLEDAVAKSGVSANKVESLEFVSGVITADDLAYIKADMKNSLKTLKMNLSDTLKFIDKEGAESTAIPGNALQNTGIVTLEIGGFTEIKSLAFQYCTALTAVSMPDMEVIGKDAFYGTDRYREIYLPASIKTLNSCGLGTAKNGTKTIHVYMETATPPADVTSPFKAASTDSYVVIPEGSLPSYLPNLDLSKVHYHSGDLLWANTRVVDPGYHKITYIAYYQTEEGGTKYSNTQYAYVKDGEAVTQDRISAGPSDNLGKELTGWNTKEDGTGTELTAETVPTESMTVYAIWEEPKADVITVKINGTEVKGSSLEDAVAESGVAVKDLTDLEIVSGIVTQDDLDYISKLTYVENFAMNIGENLTLYGKDGNMTTVLGADAAVLKFADAPSGWNKPAIRTVTLGGITEIQNGGLTAKSVETISMPDVITVGASAFANFSWLEEIDLSKAEVIGELAFFRCTNLTDITLEAVTTLKEGAFKYTNSLKKMTLPETLKTIENIEFGVVTQGNKNGTKITLKAMIPPTVANGAFRGVASSGTTQSNFIVPHGALAAYVATINPKADAAGVLKISDTIWNNLYLLEEGSYRISYVVPQKSWLTQYAFVTEGEAITEKQIAEVTPKDAGMEGYELAGWNTKSDGTGTALNAGDVIAGNMTVYPVWEEPKADVITVKINGTEVKGSSLEDAVAESGVAVKDLTDLEIVSGIVTQDDLDYISELTYVENFAMNIGEDLKLYDRDGNETTVLGADAAVLKFADAPSGWSKPAIRTVTLGGITEIQNGGLTAKSVETISMPDVITVGTSAFANFSWLEEINLAKAEVIGESAFFNCTRLTDITLDAVKILKKGAFEHTNSLKKMTLPATLVIIEDIKFGETTQGNKSGTQITMEGMVPPTVAGGAFDGVPSITKQSNVIVPHGALAAYVATINPKADATGVLKIKDTIWNNLYLLEEGSYRVTYEVPQKSWLTQYAFVTEGEAITEKQIAEVTPKDAGMEGYVLTGWNTAKDGTGTALNAGDVIAGNMTVYPVWAEVLTVIFNVDGTETPVDVVKDTALGDKLPAAPEKEGYEFKGWNTQADGSGDVVTADTVVTEEMTVYAVFEKVEKPAVPTEIDTVTAENGKVTISLKDKPTTAPTEEDFDLTMNLDGVGDRDIIITGFEYDGDKTVVITFEPLAQTDKVQKYTVTVVNGDETAVSNEVVVEAKADEEKPGTGEKPGDGDKPSGDKKPDGNKKPDSNKADAAKTGDHSPIVPLAAGSVVSLGLILAVLVFKKRRNVK